MLIWFNRILILLGKEESACGPTHPAPIYGLLAHESNQIYKVDVILRFYKVNSGLDKLSESAVATC